MIQTVDLEVRERLGEYVEGRSTLRQFQEWFIPIAWHVSGPNPNPTDDLSSMVELALAEFSNGHWTEQELKEILGGLPYIVTIGNPQGLAATRTWSTSASEPMQFEVPPKAAAAS
jgi:hypothetical protein